MKHDVIWNYAWLSLFIQNHSSLLHQIVFNLLLVIIFSNQKYYFKLRNMIILIDKGNSRRSLLRSTCARRLPIKQSFDKLIRGRQSEYKCSSEWEKSSHRSRIKMKARSSSWQKTTSTSSKGSLRGYSRTV